MFCEKCGAKLEEKALFCCECGEAVLPPVLPEEPAVQETPAPVESEPAPVESEPAPVPVEPAPAKKEKKAKEYKPRRKPHIALRILLQTLSFVLCLVLSVSLVATVVLADLNHMMSAGGMQQIVNAILMPGSEPNRNEPAPQPQPRPDDPVSQPRPNEPGSNARPNEPTKDTQGSMYTEEVPPEGTVTIPGDLEIDEIPEDILTGGNSTENVDSLVDWIYDQVVQAIEGEMPLSREEFAEFMADSTFREYLAEKLAGYAEDFINGTQNTVITTEEVQQLLDENLELIEEKFDVQISEADKEELTQSVGQMMEKNDINTVIRDQVFDAVEDSINQNAAVTGMTWEQLQPKLQVLCADTTLYIALGICGAIMLLLCLLNFYNVPAGLTWIAVPSIILGTILTVPLLLLKPLSGLFTGAPAMVLQILVSFADTLLPFHAAVLGLGIVLLIVSIAWRIIRSNIDRKRRMAAGV